MTRPLLLAAATAALLAGCGDQPEPVREPADVAEPSDRIVLDEEAAEAPAQAEEPDRRAAVTDTLGTFEGEVHGIAVWEHPSLSYESAVLAANGEAGLAVVSVDADVPMQVVEGTFDGGVAVAYPAEGDALVAAASGDEVVLFVMGADRVLAEVARLPASGGSETLCMTADLLVRVGSDGVARTATLTREGDDVALGAEEAGAEGVLACAATGDAIYGLRADGWVIGLVPSDERRYSLDAGGATIAAVAAEGLGDVVLVGDARGDVVAIPTPPAAEQRLSARLTLDGEASVPEIMAAGSGNFGSLYRDGVLALVDDGGALRLAPWAGLSRAFGLSEVYDLDSDSSVSLRPASATAGGPDLTLPAPQIAPPSLD